MGGTHSTPRKKLIFLGLDNAGKSSIVRALIGANPYTVAPTRGFNTREFEFDNISLNIFDIGGQKSLRSQWKTFWNDAAGIVWVVDSSDRRRLIETGLELAALLQDGRLKGVPILIFANKQDLTTSLSAADISIELELDSIRDHNWQIQGCSALRKTGIEDGLKWMVGELNRN